MVRCDVGVKGYWKQRTRAAVPQSDAAVGPAGDKKERLARAGPARRRTRTCVLGCYGSGAGLCISLGIDSRQLIRGTGRSVLV